MADHERQGTGYDSGATGHERQGRETLPVATTEAVGIETPLCAPWRIVETPVGISIVDNDGDEVFYGDDGDQTLWAPIVRAVNAHDELVKALEDARRYVSEIALDDKRWAQRGVITTSNTVEIALIERIDAALSRSKAQGG